MQNTQIGISAKALRVIALIRKVLANSPTGVSFFSIRNYKNSHGEIANYVINIGIRYRNSVEKDIEFLRNLDVTTLVGFKSSKLMLEKAKVALIEAFEKPNEARSKGQTEAYEIINEAIKVHKETGVVYIWGYKVSKTVIVEGEYPKVNSSEMTIAKNELRKLLKTSKYSQFGLEVGNELVTKGETIEL